MPFRTTHRASLAIWVVLTVGMISNAFSGDSDVATRLRSLVASFSCDLPPGVDDFQPLLGISDHESAREALAREFIELYRRSGKESSWDDAAVSFYIAQTRLARNRGNLVEDLRVAKAWSDWYQRGANPFKSDEYLIQAVTNKRDFYVSACRDRNSDLVWIAQMQRDLNALRREKSKPWLSQRNRLICDIKETLGCRK